MKPLVRILAVLATGGIAYFGWHTLSSFSGDSALDRRADHDLDAIKSALKAYKAHTGHYPSTEQGLSALIQRPSTEPPSERWIQTMKFLPRDPWGREYRYLKVSGDREGGFEVSSAGKDGVFATEDDHWSIGH